MLPSRPGQAWARSALSGLLAFAAFCAPAAGGGSAAVDIRGNFALSRKDLEAAIDSVACAPGDPTCAERICRAVGEAYWSRGYVRAEVACEKAEGGGDTLRVFISEGVIGVLESVEFDGVDPGDSAAVASVFKGVLGQPLSGSQIEGRIGDVLAFYDRRGHPLARVEPEFSLSGGGGVGLVLKANPGPRATIGAISLRGIRHTKASAVLPQTGIREGQVYDGAEIETARGNLMRLGVFEEVSEPLLAFNLEDTTVSVAFDVTEARTSFVDGVLGYAPGVRGGELAGTARLELASIGGTLRKLKILWGRRSDGRLSWSIYYREPRIITWPIAVETSLASDVVDTLYARRTFAVGAVYVGRPGLQIGFGALLGSTKDRSAAGEGSFDEEGLSFFLSREGRERPLNPAGGTFFEAEQEIESLDYTGGEAADRTLTRLDVRGEVIVPVASGVNLALGSGFAGAVSSSGNVPASHMIRLGGLATLRGYPEDWFRCEKAVRLSLELRKLLGPESRVHVFFDVATLETESLSLWRSGDAAFGYGAGVMAAAGRTVLRVEVAVGRDDSWSEAKLHLGIVQEF